MWGCDGGGDTSGPGGSGGTGGTTTGTTTSMPPTTGTMSTGTSTKMYECEGKLNGTSCGDCMEGQCCQHLGECLEDEACLNCLVNPASNPDLCAEENFPFAKLIACKDDLCTNQCAPASCDAPAMPPSNGTCLTLGGTIACNPMTNEGCDLAAGEACDFSPDGFTCYPVSQNEICQPCGQNDGFCAPGMVCAGVCTRYCCDDADCGTGKCKKGDFAAPTIGYCITSALGLACENIEPDGECLPGKDTCACTDCSSTAYCNPGQCKTDGACTIDDSCVCPDCDDEPSCSCNYDDVCNPFTEGCKCTDCWTEPECADNPMDPCTDDGACGVAEWCSCLDCKDTGFCLDPNHCTEDGMCDPYEGCVCNDCKMVPSCL